MYSSAIIVPVDLEILGKLRLKTACIMGFSKLLLISYKFVKGFLAITFVLLVISNWNFHDVYQRFLYNKKRIFR